MKNYFLGGAARGENYNSVLKKVDLVVTYSRDEGKTKLRRNVFFMAKCGPDNPTRRALSKQVG